MNELVAAKAELVECGTSAFERGLTPGCTGNLSAIVGDKVVTTPTGSSLGRLSPAGLSTVSLRGERLSGPAPTKEIGLHLALYASGPIRAVVHLHSPYAVAFSCLDGISVDRPIPFLTPYSVMQGRDLRLVRYLRPGSTELVHAVEDAVRQSQCLLLQRHGLLVGGSSLAAAMDAAEEIEQSALIALTVGSRGREMSAAEVAEL
jgi:ribulose-5-phosphate 4-epimerase/fuculose-1-phosphate aldolase